MNLIIILVIRCHDEQCDDNIVKLAKSSVIMKNDDVTIKNNTLIWYNKLNEHVQILYILYIQI